MAVSKLTSSKSSKPALNLPAGFTTNAHAEDKLAISIYGDHGSGKTRFGCTMPGVIAVLPLDRKTRRTCEIISKELGKTMVFPEKDFIRVADPVKLASMPVEESRKIYRKHVDEVMLAAYRMIDIKGVDSLLIDSGTQLWEDILFAEYGRSQRIMPRDRGPANQTMRDFLNALSGKHVVITHRSSEIYKDDNPTGKYKMEGFSKMGYCVNVMAQLELNDKKRPSDEGRWALHVMRCQNNPEIQGPGGRNLLLDDAITFSMLACQVYPDSDPEEWE